MKDSYHEEISSVCVWVFVQMNYSHTFQFTYYFIQLLLHYNT